MKKIILSIIYFLACIFFIQGQTFYGTTFNGGSGNGGTINKYIPATNNLIVEQSFEDIDPNSHFTDLIQAKDGKFYGMTTDGGSSRVGVIFSFDPSSSTFTKLKDLDGTNGAAPYGSLVEATDGKLYGMTSGGGNGGVGVIFSYDPSSSTYTKLHDFDVTNGASPTGSLIQARDGKLYGLTPSGGPPTDNSCGCYNLGDNGVIFSYDIYTGVFTKLRDMDNNHGGKPFGSLMQANDGKLYGMTNRGGFIEDRGAAGYGAIFSFDPSFNIYTKLMDFEPFSGINPLGNLIQSGNGKLYGLASAGGYNNVGVIFSFDPSADTYTQLYNFDNANGANPSGSLTRANDGKLYAMTPLGGNNGVGVIFSIDTSILAYTKLKDFDIGKSANPTGSFIKGSDGKLYSTTGGISFGLIFSFSTPTSTYTTLKDFATNERGGSLSGSLIQASDGKLYGMTVDGGSSTKGVIYSFEPSDSTYTKLKDFDNINGANPYGSLVQANNGKLYGMTSAGGSRGAGVIFSFEPSASTFTKLKDFDSTNGGTPHGSLIQASNGKLYGMASGGGSRGAGVIFSFDPASSIYTKLMDFDYDNGGQPNGSLLQASDGKLYGMTTVGGLVNGVIFSFDLSSSVYTVLKIFSDQANPYGSLVQSGDGKLYGMTSLGGTNGAGVIFSYDPSTATYTKLKDFDYNNGGRPYGNLMEASDGKLYGMTHEGGGSNLGVIFSFNPSDSTFTKLIDYNGVNGANPYLGSGFITVTECIAKTFFKDADGDGYGNPNDSIKTCTQPAGYVADSTDCDDTKASVHPGATEICGNGIDDNCNGQIDEGCSIEPTVSINDVTVNESQGIAKLTVTLSHASSKPVWLLYYTKDGTAVNWGRHKDYQARFGFVFIRPGSLTGTISIRIFKDNISEPTEYFDVIVWKSLHADIADGSGRVSISDDMPVTNSKIDFMQRAETSSANSLEIKVMPNPSSSQFSLTVVSNDKTAGINMKVMDVQGKLIEGRNNLLPGQTIRLGSNYRPGTYFIHAIQGKQRTTTTVIKMSE